MTHFKIMNLLSCLSESKKILEELDEFEDHDLLELLEFKYEKLYHQTLLKQ